MFKRTNTDNLNMFCFHCEIDVDDEYLNFSPVRGPWEIALVSQS